MALLPNMRSATQPRCSEVADHVVQYDYPQVGLRLPTCRSTHEGTLHAIFCAELPPNRFPLSVGLTNRSEVHLTPRSGMIPTMDFSSALIFSPGSVVKCAIKYSLILGLEESGTLTCPDLALSISAAHPVPYSTTRRAHSWTIFLPYRLLLLSPPFFRNVSLRNL